QLQRVLGLAAGALGFVADVAHLFLEVLDGLLGFVDQFRAARQQHLPEILQLQRAPVFLVRRRLVAGRDDGAAAGLVDLVGHHLVLALGRRRGRLGDHRHRDLAGLARRGRRRGRVRRQRSLDAAGGRRRGRRHLGRLLRRRGLWRWLGGGGPGGRDRLCHRLGGGLRRRRGLLRRGSLLRRRLFRRHGLLRHRLLRRRGLLRHRLLRRRGLLRRRLLCRRGLPRHGLLRRRGLLRDRFLRGGLLRSRLLRGRLGGGLLGRLGGLLHGFLRCHEQVFLIVPLRRESALLYPARHTAATARKPRHAACEAVIDLSL